MLDENLPTFFIKTSRDNSLSSTIFLSHSGNEPQPEYTLRRPDPSQQASKNRYGIALYDSHNADVLYGEVLVQPEWSQPTLSAAELRAQNGIPPPPVPIVPTSITIQLYNPDQQVTVKQIPGTWKDSAHWEFELPQQTFRTPSASALDRSQDDPTVSDITPKVAFKWKRDGKLSKDITCYLSGKSMHGKKSKEPDITVAYFKRDKEFTLYEPNLYRIDVEDAKGLEVVLILGAVVIKDIFFNVSRDTFNISSGPSGLARKNSNSPLALIGRKSTANLALASGGISDAPLSSSPPKASSSSYRIPNVPKPSKAPAAGPRYTNNHSTPYPPAERIPSVDSASAYTRPHATSAPAPPPADARTQWEIDAETARLRKLVEKEEAAEREARDKAEQKRIKKMLEQEERERQRREAEVEKETERLRKQFGVTAIDDSVRPQNQSPHVRFHPALPPRPSGNGYNPPAIMMSPAGGPPALEQYQSAPHSRPVPVQRPVSTNSMGPNSNPNYFPPPPQQPQQPSGPFHCDTLNGWWNGPTGSSGQSSSSRPPQGQGNSPYLQPGGGGQGASSSGFFGGRNDRKKRQKKRSSVW